MTLNNTLERLAKDAVESVLPGVLARMEADVGKVLEQARSEWPVKSGASKGGLRLDTLFTDSSVTVRIVNPVAYAPFVRPRALFGSTTAWARFVQKPMSKARKELVKALGQTIADSLRQGLKNG